MTNGQTIALCLMLALLALVLASMGSTLWDILEVLREIENQLDITHQ